MLRKLLFLPVLVFAFSAHADEKKLHVVASFSILADMVREVGGDAVDVYSLVPAGSDVHLYEPTPADVQRIKQADLVVINGLGFEGWMTRLIESSGYKGKLVEASNGITLRKMEEDHHEVSDPHGWQDVSNAQIYAANIAAALKNADAAHIREYDANSASYIDELKSLHAEIRAVFAAIPQAQRKVITSHDAFGYFAHAYGIIFLAPLGMNTDSEPSAQGIARLIDQIRAEHINALFVENISNKRLIEQLETDSGARLGGTLYSDALSPAGGSAPTYIDMMRHNASTLAAAMMQGSIEKK